MTKAEREKAIATYTKRFKCREKTVEECEGMDCGECPLFYDDDELHEAERIALETLKQDQAAEPCKGEWIETGETILTFMGTLLFECQCSKCKGLAFFRKESLEHKLVGADFCPCCGADMRKEQK